MKHDVSTSGLPSAESVVEGFVTLSLLWVTHGDESSFKGEKRKKKKDFPQILINLQAPKSSSFHPRPEDAAFGGTSLPAVRCKDLLPHASAYIYAYIPNMPRVSSLSILARGQEIL